MSSPINIHAPSTSIDAPSASFPKDWKPLSLDQLDQTPIQGHGRSPWMKCSDAMIRYPNGIAIDATYRWRGLHAWQKLSLVLAALFWVMVVLTNVGFALGFAMSMGIYLFAMRREATLQRRHLDRASPEQQWRITPTAIELTDDSYHERFEIARFHRFWLDDTSLELISRGTTYRFARDRISADEWQRLVSWVGAQLPPAIAQYRSIAPVKAEPIARESAGVNNEAIVASAVSERIERDDLGGMNIWTRLGWMIILVGTNLSLIVAIAALQEPDGFVNNSWRSGITTALVGQLGLLALSFRHRLPHDPTCRTAVEPNGIVYWNSFGWSRIGWSLISASRKSYLGYVLVSERRGVMYPILRRAFASEEDWRRVEQIIRENTKLDTGAKSGRK
jgi:hypothetical protein